MKVFSAAIFTSSLVRFLGMGIPNFFLVSGIPIACVVTFPSYKKNDSQDMLGKFLRQSNISCFFPDSLDDDKFQEQFFRTNPSVIASIAYARRIPKEILRGVPLGAIGLHRSLLPRYQGGAPAFWAIRNRDKESGVTIFRLNEEFDKGEFYLQKKIRIKKDETAAMLGFKSLTAGIPLLIEVLKKLKHGKMPRRIPQNPDEMIPAPIPSNQMLEIDWRKSAIEILTLIRAHFPGRMAHTSFRNTDLKIWSANIGRRNKKKITPGTLVISENKLEVATSDYWISLETVQIHPNRVCSWQEFLQISKVQSGECLGQ